MTYWKVNMMHTSNKSLNHDIYCFLSSRIVVASDSNEVLNFFRLRYGRFFTGSGAGMPDVAEGAVAAADFTLTVKDEIAAFGRLLVDEEGRTHRLQCKDLLHFDYTFYTGRGTVPNPLEFIHAVFLSNLYGLLKRDYHLIHAGAVAWNGGAVIFPAAQGMGKTTLTIQLLKKGFRFLSDEIACLSLKSRRVEPFARALNITERSRRLLELPPFKGPGRCNEDDGETEWTVDVEELFTRDLSESCKLSRIVFLRGYGERPRLEYLAGTNALFNLVKFSLSPVDNGALLLYELAPLFDGVDCYNLVAGDPFETADLVAKMVQED